MSLPEGDVAAVVQISQSNQSFVERIKNKSLSERLKCAFFCAKMVANACDDASIPSAISFSHDSVGAIIIKQDKLVAPPKDPGFSKKRDDATLTLGNVLASIFAQELAKKVSQWTPVENSMCTHIKKMQDGCI